jgi:hypothetical protein
VSSELPIWLLYVQALAVPLVAIIIAGFGAWIAWNQMRIARSKLQHDLFEKRFAVFEGARRLLLSIGREGSCSDQALQKYAIGTSDAVFLLDDTLSEYVEELWKHAAKLHALAEQLKDEPAGTERGRLARLKGEDVMWFMAQHEVLIAKFKPFLRLSENTASPRRRWRPW